MRWFKKTKMPWSQRRTETLRHFTEVETYHRHTAGEDFTKVTQIGVMLDDFAIKPQKAHEEDAGFDLFMPIDKFGMASPQRWMEVDTGVHMIIPKGYCGLLVSKSGLNIKHNLTSTGLIDSGFTGSIRVKLYNHGSEHVTFKGGDKISQIIILPVPDVELVDIYELPETDRGSNGFGSTGVNIFDSETEK